MTLKLPPPVRSAENADASPEGLGTFNLSNRRYLGSKSKILDVIFDEITTRLGKTPESLLDAFAGSGVVAAKFASTGSKVIANDLLLHNSIAHWTFLNHSEYNHLHAKQLISEMGKLTPLNGYATETFGGKYFSVENAMRLDAAREFIANEIDNSGLQRVALTSLIYAADKVAQTVGHYDAFFNRQSIDKEIEFKFPELTGSGEGNLVTTADANLVVREHSVDVLYLDPPYNSRQYSDSYHALENLARWEKPEVFGVARKFDRTNLKSRYSTRSAFEAFRDLVENASAQLIVLSYSNTGDSRATRSNNVLSDDEINLVLSSVGTTEVVNIDFREFSTGRTSKREHKERLFFCQVG